MDGLHGKAAQLDLLLGGDLHELGLAGQAELLQLVPDQAAGQAGAVDGQVELLQQIRDAADVVRDHHVHAVHLAVREHQTAVHDDHVPVALIHGHVLAHFAQTAQRVDVDGRCSLLGLLRAAGAAVVVGPPGGAGALFPGRCRGCGCVLLCAGSRDRVFFFFRLSHS